MHVVFEELSQHSTNMPAPVGSAPPADRWIGICLRAMPSLRPTALDDLLSDDYLLTLLLTTSGYDQPDCPWYGYNTRAMLSFVVVTSIRPLVTATGFPSSSLALPSVIDAAILTLGSCTRKAVTY